MHEVQRSATASEATPQQDAHSAVTDAEREAYFIELINIITEHLPDKRRASAIKHLRQKLRSEHDVEDILAAWFMQVTIPGQVALGTISLDWKAREEVEWQAQSLLKSHQIEAAWNYDFKSDFEWQNTLSDDRFPVDYPLDLFNQFLDQHGYRLIRFSPYDNVCAFAVPQSKYKHVSELMCKLSLTKLADKA